MANRLWIKREDFFKKDFGFKKPKMFLYDKVKAFLKRHSEKGYKVKAIMGAFRVKSEWSIHKQLQRLVKEKRILHIAPFYTWNFGKNGPRKKRGKKQNDFRRTIKRNKRI